MKLMSGSIRESVLAGPEGARSIPLRQISPSWFLRSTLPLPLLLSLTGNTPVHKGKCCNTACFPPKSELGGGHQGRKKNPIDYQSRKPLHLKSKIAITSNRPRRIWAQGWRRHRLSQAMWRTCSWAGVEARRPDFKSRPFSKHCASS